MLVNLIGSIIWLIYLDYWQSDGRQSVNRAPICNLRFCASISCAHLTMQIPCSERKHIPASVYPPSCTYTTKLTERQIVLCVCALDDGGSQLCYTYHRCTINAPACTRHTHMMETKAVVSPATAGTMCVYEHGHEVAISRRDADVPIGCGGRWLACAPALSIDVGPIQSRERRPCLQIWRPMNDNQVLCLPSTQRRVSTRPGKWSLALGRVPLSSIKYSVREIFCSDAGERYLWWRTLLGWGCLPAWPTLLAANLGAAV